MQIIWCFYL